MKTYVLTVSRYFPATHKRKGEETFFVDKIRFMLGGWNLSEGKNGKKIHTIRANYELWAKRIKEVQEGKAILSIRYWSGKPYNSKQVEIWQLDQHSGCGVQKLEFYKDKDEVPSIKYPLISNLSEPDINSIAKNDGLSLEDFKEWFKSYDLSEPMAIIHFTSFRY